MIGCIVMTALPPTEGHAALIRFGKEFMRSIGGTPNDLHVILSKRPNEPGDREFHIKALEEFINSNAAFEEGKVNFHLDYYDGPENPNPAFNEDSLFWERWIETIRKYCNWRTPNYIFSSETYGYELANWMVRLSGAECEHIPFNIARDQNVVKATSVREDIIGQWQQLIPPIRRKYTQSIVLFGQESVGKTTLARQGAKMFNSVFINEWARPYLENLQTPEVTADRMFKILYGQTALEQSAKDQFYTPFRFYDTDLLSTIGYWDFWLGNKNSVFYDEACYAKFMTLAERLWKPKDLYIIPRDNIPFEPDPLRYGGDKRETDLGYWVYLCEKYDVRYYIMQERSVGGRMEELEDQCRKQLHRAIGFDGYKRER